MDIEKLSEEMTKSDSFKRLPVIQRISAPGFSGPMEESPVCKRLLTTEFGGVKRNKSKKFISRKSNYRSSKRYRRVKKRSS
jgi:hypothetical protein